MSLTSDILDDLIAETVRADEKFGRQYDLPDGTGMGLADLTEANYRRRVTQMLANAGTVDWRAILHEEVAEAFAESEPDRLRAELLQVAAVALRWVDAIDERGRP